MHRALLNEDLGRTAPDHHLAIGLRLELCNVVANLVGEVALVLANLLHLGVEALDPALVERGGHRLDALQKRPHAVELIAVEHVGGLRGVVQIAAEDVPASEDDVVQVGDGSPVLDERRVVVGALAETDGSHLAHRADGLCEAAANSLDAGNQRRCNGSHSGDHDS